jgi:hypothetical protein
MGNSGGRSSGNRTAQGAEERSTQRQRSYIDPPGHSSGEPEDKMDIVSRAMWWAVDEAREGTFWAAFLGAVMAIALCKLIGLI